VRIVEVVLEVPRSRQRDAERAVYAEGAQGLELRKGARGHVQIVTWVPLSERNKTATALRRVGTVRTRVIEANWVARSTITFGGLTIVGIERAVGFGDGLHPTTKLCLDALRRTRLGTVLDVGTGTGILAIAAKMLGATHVVATDVDPLARAAARSAIKANGVAVRVQAKLPRAKFDVVVANLYHDVIATMLPELIARTKSELIVSGFTSPPPIEGAWVTERSSRGKWQMMRLIPAPG
jgi:SAM-dependent methyltransferase